MDFWKIYFEELKIIGIHVYEPIDIEITLELLNEYPHIFQPFISKVICLENLQEELLELSAGKSSAMKILVKFGQCD
jgi:threonine dehydrogenase-like Zn-dependent dehydrogenase